MDKDTKMITIAVPSLRNKKIDLSNQTYKDFEVIVDGDGSIVEVMNRAIKNAKGNIIVRTDDDCVFPPHWLEEIDKTFKDNPDCAIVTGPTIIPKELLKNRDVFNFRKFRWPLKQLYYFFMDGNPYRIGRLYSSGCFSLGSNFIHSLQGETRPVDFAEACNHAFRKDIILDRQVMGFDEKFDGLCEYYENDAFLRLKEGGWKIYYNPKAYVEHHIKEATGNRTRIWGRNKNFIRFCFRRVNISYKFFLYLIFINLYFLYKMLLFVHTRLGHWIFCKLSHQYKEDK